MVQVRQHAEHKRTFLFLEQLILKHELSQKLLNVVERPDGLDFHFPNKQSALHFSDFCQSRFPCTCKQGKQLVSHDASSNTYFHKYTISLTLAPVCKDDLVYLDKKQARSQLGGFSSLAVCTRVAAAGIALCDPFTGRTVNLSVEKYWKNPFSSLCTRKHLTSFLVLDVTPVEPPAASSNRKHRANGTHRSRDREDQTGERQRQEGSENGMNGFEEMTIERDDGVSVFYPNGLPHASSTSGSPSTPPQKGQTNFQPCSSSNNKKKKRRNSHSSMFSQAPGGESREDTTSNVMPRREDHHQHQQSSHQGSFDHKAGGAGVALYEVELARASDVGVSDRRIITRTHIGNLLRPGDWVRGYDLRSINLPGSADHEFEQDRSHSSSQGSSLASSGALSRKEKRRQRNQKGASVDEDDAADDHTSSLARRLLEEQQQEQLEEEGLAAYVQFEVVLIKKQPVTQLWAGSQSKKGDKMIGQSSAHGVPRPWVLQTLMKEKEGGGFRSKKRSGGRGGGGGGKGSRRRDGDLLREDEDGEAGDIDEDMEDFKQELEEDAEMRGQVNLWRDPRYSRKKKGTGGKEPQKQKAAAAKKGANDKNSSKNQPDDKERGSAARSREGEREGFASAPPKKPSSQAKQQEDGEDWEDLPNERQEGSSDDGDDDDEELLTNLMEGLTLEQNGEIKGLYIKPGAPHLSAEAEEDGKKAEKSLLAKVPPHEDEDDDADVL